MCVLPKNIKGVLISCDKDTKSKQIVGYVSRQQVGRWSIMLENGTFSDIGRNTEKVTHDLNNVRLQHIAVQKDRSFSVFKAQIDSMQV